MIEGGGLHLRPDISAELREKSRDSPAGAHFRHANVLSQSPRKISAFGRITDRFTTAKTMRQSGDRRQCRSHRSHARAGGNDVGSSFCRKDPGIIRCHGADNRNAAPAGLARQRAAGVPIPPGSERGPAHKYVRLNLAKPTQQPRQRLRFVLAEEIVAAGQCDVYMETGRFQSSAWAYGSADPPRCQPGRFFTAQASEELIEIMDNDHAGTAVSAMSPVCVQAPR